MRWGGTLIAWMHVPTAQKSAAPTAMDATIHGDEGAESRLNDGGGACTVVTILSAFVAAPTANHPRQKLGHFRAAGPVRASCEAAELSQTLSRRLDTLSDLCIQRATSRRTCRLPALSAFDAVGWRRSACHTDARHPNEENTPSVAVWTGGCSRPRSLNPTRLHHPHRLYYRVRELAVTAYLASGRECVVERAPGGLWIYADVCDRLQAGCAMPRRPAQRCFARPPSFRRGKGCSSQGGRAG